MNNMVALVMLGFLMEGVFGSLGSIRKGSGLTLSDWPSSERKFYADPVTPIKTKSPNWKPTDDRCHGWTMAG